MIELLKRIYRTTPIGKPFIFFYHSIIKPMFSDEYFIRTEYRKKMGETLNLEKPVTLNQKICWLKLNDRTELHTTCADKYAVRNYISKTIGEEYLVPLLYQTENPENIVPENMPTPPYIIKTNHDSGGGVIVKEKSNINWQEVQVKMKKRLAKNYYRQSREWQYKNISPRIIVEKLLVDSNDNLPFDYKVHVFNGKANMIQVDIGRDSDNHFRNWYSLDWKREPYKWSSPKKGNKRTDPSKDDVPKPNNLEQMIKLSEMLAKPFDYVRIDWYDVDGTLYFGEITFHHDGGYQPILPKEWDIALGEKVMLTKNNH